MYSREFCIENDSNFDEYQYLYGENEFLYTILHMRESEQISHKGQFINEIKCNIGSTKGKFGDNSTFREISKAGQYVI